jgi:hypothetical protein
MVLCVSQSNQVEEGRFVQVTLLALEFKPKLFDAMDFAAVYLRPIIDLSGRRPAWNFMDLYRRISTGTVNMLDLEPAPRHGRKGLP